MTFRRNLILAIIMLFCFGCATAGPNVTGTWLMDVQLAAGSGTPTFKLTQEGENITGTYNGQLGEAPVTGTIKDKDVELDIKMAGMGQEMTVVYAGTLQEDGTLKGTVNMGQFGEGTFTGKKEEEKTE